MYDDFELRSGFAPEYVWRKRLCHAAKLGLEDVEPFSRGKFRTLLRALVVENLVTTDLAF